MRINQIVDLLKQVEPELVFKTGTITGSNAKLVRGHGSLNDAVRLLEEAGLLSKEVGQVLAFPAILRNVEDEIVVPHDVYANFSQRLKELKASVGLLIPLVETLVFAESETTLSVKLPPALTLSELSDFIEELDGALRQAVANGFVKGSPAFDGFDRGSDWLIIALGSKVAAQVVKLIGDQYLAWRGKLAEISGKEEAVRSFKIANDSSEAFGKIIKEAVEVELKALKQEMDIALVSIAEIPKDSNEDRARLINARGKIWEILDKGAELHLKLFPAGNSVPSAEQVKISGTKQKSLPAAPAEET